MNYESSMHFDSKVIEGVEYWLHKPSYGLTLAFDRKNASYREQARKLQQRQDDLREELDFVRKAWDAEHEAKVKDLKVQLASVAEDAKPAIQAQIDKIENGWEYERLIDRGRIVKDEEKRKELAEKIVAIGDNKTMFQMPKELVAGYRELREDAEFTKASDYYPARLKWGLAKISGIEIDGQPANADSLIEAGPTDLVREIIQQIDELATMTSEQLRNFPLRSTSPEAADGNANDTTASDAKSPESTKEETA